MPADVLYLVSVWVLPVLLAITFHEAAHAYVAWRLGDDTAYLRGRVSFNPLKHVDPVGTVLVPALLLLTRPGFLFGWAKPVPVNFSRLGRPRRDMVLVALAGPGINVVLALVSALLLRAALTVEGPQTVLLLDNLANSIRINVLLAVFNMIPLPPLDGGRVAVGLLPAPLAIPLARLERYGLMILIGVLLLLPMIGRQLGADLDLFGTVIGVPVRWLLSVVLAAAGLAPA